MSPLQGETPLEKLVDLLDLERIEVDIFRGKQPHEALQRAFGGQVAGQALVAARRTAAAGRPAATRSPGRRRREARERVCGGQVAGQPLVAAGRTVPADRPVHSLHAYFLRPGDPAVTIIYLVDRIRDGRSFTTRRVVAVQHGRPIFNLAASFALVEPGLEHQLD